jgi:hypothetical protein
LETDVLILIYVCLLNIAEICWGVVEKQDMTFEMRFVVSLLSFLPCFLVSDKVSGDIWSVGLAYISPFFPLLYATKVFSFSISDYLGITFCDFVSICLSLGEATFHSKLGKIDVKQGKSSTNCEYCDSIW